MVYWGLRWVNRLKAAGQAVRLSCERLLLRASYASAGEPEPRSGRRRRRGQEADLNTPNGLGVASRHGQLRKKLMLVHR